MPQNQTLIGCLDKTSQDQQLKLSCQIKIHIKKNNKKTITLFLRRNIVGAPRQISIANTLQVPPDPHFFLISSLKTSDSRLPHLSSRNRPLIVQSFF